MLEIASKAMGGGLAPLSMAGVERIKGRNRHLRHKGQEGSAAWDISMLNHREVKIIIHLHLYVVSLCYF